ncbi:MAG: bromodomain adjacent to zinc finger domain 1A-like isoform X1 [Trebouxia sp. A1-2]|nr:MAG: bromodomain adjacent to zinc finger domain 1A-like isoform X1 [Trebouxia sp. A1-2]
MISVATAGLILILKDGKPRQEVDLVADQCLSMGKSPSNSIILPDKGIRSEHIKLLVDSQGQALFDSLGHKNVLVNGRLEQGPVQLKDGDLIEATLEQRLAEKAVEMQILQEQNDRLRAQAVMAQAADTEELVEPTLVLPSPPKVMPTGPADPSFATTTALYPARHNDTLHVSAVHTQQGKQRIAAKLTAQSALPDEDSLQLHAVDSLAAADGQAAAVDADKGFNSLPGVVQDEGAQHVPAGQEERLSHIVFSNAAQCDQAQEVASDPKPSGGAVKPVDLAGLAEMSQVMAIPAHAASGEVPQDSSKLATQQARTIPSSSGLEPQDGDLVITSQLGSTSIPEGHVTLDIVYTSILNRQPSMREGQEAIARGQAVLPAWLDITAHAQSTDGQAASHANQQPPDPSILPEGQPTMSQGQVDVCDGHNTIPEEQSIKPYMHATASDGQASSADGQETISDACCVCHSGEDGEIMLLCDKCDKPAHLGCVGMEAVPEGDWFCPSCTAIMAGEHSLQAQQCDQGRALQQSSGVDDIVGLEHSGAGGKAPSKWMAPGGRMGVSVADAPANAAGDETGTAGLPVKKRSRRTISGGKAQQNKENAAANQPAVKKRRQTQCPARAVKKAPMKTQGPRRSTRLADK